MKNETWNLKKKYFNQFLKLKFYPETYIIQSFFSNSYSKINFKGNKKAKVLDIGTLYLNNLLPFGDRGHKLYATEINENTVSFLKKLHKNKCIIKLGTNRNLPFKNNFFDIILSINTIHYEKNMEDMEKAIIEFKRVLKKNGILFIRTVAPDHFFKKKKTLRIKKNIYKCIDKREIRYGQNFTYFENKLQLNNFLKKHFKVFEIGEVYEKFPKRIVNSYMIKCKK